MASDPALPSGTARPAPAAWHHAAWRVVVALLAAAVLGFGLGSLATSRSSSSTPSGDSADVMFLQEMRAHHDQATVMALGVVGRDDADPMVRAIAIEILLGQQLESGLMVQLLRGWDQPEQLADEDLAAMDMPGMATPEQLDQLAAATGTEADRLFAELMVAHHRGGIAMADRAAEDAEHDDVRQLAAGMAQGQRGEVAELLAVLDRLG